MGVLCHRHPPCVPGKRNGARLLFHDLPAKPGKGSPSLRPGAQGARQHHGRAGLGSVVLDKLVKDSGIDALRELSPGDAPPPALLAPRRSRRGTPARLRAGRAAIAASPPHPERESVAAYLGPTARAALEPVTAVERLHEADLAKLDSGKARLGLGLPGTARGGGAGRRGLGWGGCARASRRPRSMGSPWSSRTRSTCLAFPPPPGNESPHPCGHCRLHAGPRASRPPAPLSSAGST